MQVRTVQVSAMALVAGWLWMQPPIDGSPKFIKQWEHVRSYDAARRCETAISTRYKKLMDESAPADEIAQVLNARCVPADYIYTPRYRSGP